MIKLQKTKLLGHRGARFEVLENSLAGFQHAFNLRTHGLAGVEFDVQLTADEHLIVFHDDTLQRLCGLQSRVDQLSLAEIQRHLQLGHQIITLDKLAEALISSASAPVAKQVTGSQKQVVSHSFNQSISDCSTKSANKFRQFSHIELEIKTHGRTNYTKLIKALSRYLMDTPIISLPIVLTSFDTQLLAQLQRDKLLKPIKRGLLVREPKLLIAAPNAALQLGCSSLGIHYPLLNKQVIDYCHRYGLPVSAWTVNDVALAKQLVEWQVDVIITDIPTQLLL